MTPTVYRPRLQANWSVPALRQAPAEPGRIWSLSTARAVRYALFWQALSFGLIAVQIVLVAALGWWTIILGLAGLAVLHARRPLAGVTVFLQILLYQNWLVAVLSPLGLDQTSFQALLGCAFASIGLMAAVGVVRMYRTMPSDAPSMKLVRWTLIAIAVAVLYTAYGAAGSSPVSAITYFRNTSAMLLAMLVGLDVGRTWDYRTVIVVLLTSLAIGLVISSLELFIPHTYYSMINALDYMNLKNGDNGAMAHTHSVDDIVAQRVVAWFNITGGADGAVSVRISGPNMHPISYAYIVAVAGVAAMAIGCPQLAALALGLLFMAGIKGALLMLLAACGLFALWWVTRRPRLVFVVSALVLIAYVTFGIRIGLSNGDFHVIGLLGGVNGLIAKPYGHGIGVGGNLSAVAIENLDWREFQHFGADFALESAVGVIIYQMGVAALFVIGPILRLAFLGLKRPASSAVRRVRSLLGKPRLSDVLFIGIFVTVANGTFQEEAYSPFALGLLTLLGGIVVGNLGPRSQNRTSLT